MKSPGLTNYGGCRSRTDGMATAGCSTGYRRRRVAGYWSVLPDRAPGPPMPGWAHLGDRIDPQPLGRFVWIK